MGLIRSGNTDLTPEDDDDLTQYLWPIVREMIKTAIENKQNLIVRKNKDDKISKEFYYLGKMRPSGKAEEFTMANTDKTAVEIEWILDEPVREDIYEYIVGI